MMNRKSEAIKCFDEYLKQDGSATTYSKTV